MNNFTDMYCTQRIDFRQQHDTTDIVTISDIL